VVDGFGCIEIVFSDDVFTDDGKCGRNLLTYWPDTGRFARGGVANPGRYVAGNAIRRRGA
jgi:hypothetical protein